MTPLPTLLTTREVARLYRVDRSTVVRWARAGQINSVKLPGPRGHLRFRADEIAATLGPPAEADDEAAS